MSSMPLAGVVLLFVFGLVFGSFANVVIWRFPRGESLSDPPSHCPHCGHRVRWQDNIPVLSWILLRGRCRDCSEPILVRYPTVELASGALWAIAGVVFGLSWSTAAAVFLFYLLLILAFIDLDTMRLPNPLVGLLGAGGALLAVAAQVLGVDIVPLTPLGAGWFASPIVSAVTGSLVAGGVSLGIALLYSGVRGRSGFGMGDVKLLLALGPFLGMYTIMVLLVGSVLGAIVGLVVASRSGGGGGTRIPFGPFLALGAVMVAIWGGSLWSWYLGMVGVGA